MAITAFVFVFLFSVTGRAETFFAYLNGAQQVPPAATTATGYARVVLNESAGTITFTVVFNGLTSAQTLSHIHEPGAIGVNAAVAIDFGAVGGTSGTISGTRSITPTQIAQLRAHLGYVNVHTTNFPNGEIRGQLGIKRPVDFDGDGRTDFSVLRFPTTTPPTPAPIVFWNLNSTAGSQTSPTWGDANRDFPAPGDYDADGKDDFALSRSASAANGNPEEFWILGSAGTYPGNIKYFNWGVVGDQAIARDYDGDGTTDVAVYRRGDPGNANNPSDWFILRSSSNTVNVVEFGLTGDSVGGTTGDTPIPGDYDGDGKFDVAVYRFGGFAAPNNSFIWQRSSDGVTVFEPFGNFQTDYILPGDYDGDGKFDLCVGNTGALATSPMTWAIRQSSNGQVRIQPFGISSDIPTQGDYDGDGKTDLSVYRRGATATSASTFWVFNSFTNTGTATNWGLRADFPVATFDAR